MSFEILSNTFLAEISGGQEWFPQKPIFNFEIKEFHVPKRFFKEMLSLKWYVLWNPFRNLLNIEI
jgi:hypothetical protein